MEKCDIYINQMATALTKIVRYFSGYHTETISQIMRNYKPKSEEDIIKTLNQMSRIKQYTESSPVTEAFVGRIQYFLLKNPNRLSAQTLHIYQLLKQFQILTPRFRYGILMNLQKSMQRIIDQDLTIKNNQLEVLLWFLYREYPFLRETKFQDIASNHSLKLFEMYEFMNSEKSIPTWSPFLRITTMLKALGHEVPVRKDITVKDLESLDYIYYPFLTNIFTTEEECIQFQRKHNIYEPLMMYLCNKYMDHDKIRYDQYIGYVEKIDNEEAHEEVEKVIDPLSWLNFVELLQLYVRSCEYSSIETQLSYNLSELFWRLCESKNVELQASIKLIEIIANNQFILDENIEKILLRIRDGIESFQALQFKFLPGRAFLIALSSISRLEKFDGSFRKEMSSYFIKNITEPFLWEEGEKQQLLAYLNENNIQIQENTRKFLQDKQ